MTPRTRSISAGILLGIGLFLSLLVIYAATERRRDIGGGAIVGLMIIAGTPLAIAGWLVRQNQLENRAEQERLQAIFYKLIKEDDGRINLLRFAIESNLSSEAAKIYLDAEAKQFNATFETSEAGKVFYCFEGFEAKPQEPQLSQPLTYDLVLKHVPNEKRLFFTNIIQGEITLDKKTIQQIEKQDFRKQPVTIERLPESVAQKLKKDLSFFGGIVSVKPHSSSDNS